MDILRYWEIPSFGLDGIRKITSNWSELKKMTAHDYEDILQVDMACSLVFVSWLYWYSAQYLFSMVFSQNHTTHESSNSFSIWHTGMLLQSCACIPTPLWTCCPTSLYLLETASVSSKRRPAHCLKHGNWKENTLLNNNIKRKHCQSMYNQGSQHPVITRGNQSAWTWILTRSMRWVTTPPLSDSMERRTPILLNQ